MNIATVIDWLNKNKGYHVDSQYYKHISVWVDLSAIPSIQSAQSGRDHTGEEAIQPAYGKKGLSGLGLHPAQ